MSNLIRPVPPRRQRKALRVGVKPAHRRYVNIHRDVLSWRKTRSRRPVRAEGLRGPDGFLFGLHDDDPWYADIIDTVSEIGVPVKTETYKGWDIYSISAAKGPNKRPVVIFKAVPEGEKMPVMSAADMGASNPLGILDIKENIDKYGQPYPPIEVTALTNKWTLLGISLGVGLLGLVLYSTLVKPKGKV